MEAVSVGGLKRARSGGAYTGPEAAAAAVTLKKLRLDAAAAAMNMPPTGTPPLQQQQQQQQQAASQQGAVNAVATAVDGQTVVGMCNSIDSVGTGEEEVNFAFMFFCCVFFPPSLHARVRQAIR